MSRSLAAVVASLLIATVLLAVAAPSVLANGAGKEIFRDTEGPYELVVRVQPDTPAVGAVHLTFELTIAETAEAVEDAVIWVVARDETGIDRYAARALIMPQEKRYYDANLTFEAPGDWTLVVDIERDRTSAATFEVPMPVQEPLIPSRGVAGTVAWLFVTSILVGGISLVWYRSRQALRGRKPTL